MDLTVLGAGPAYTDQPGATGAAYLVRAAGTAVLLDLGQGSFPRLTAELDPSALDAVIVSHLHPDHFIDLVPLRHFLLYQFSPGRRVRVLAPAGLARRIDALHGQPGFVAEALDVEPLQAGPFQIGAMDLEAGRVTHTAESYGFRVSPAVGGPGLVYSGDCGRAADLEALLRPGDTLLSEVSFGAGEVPRGALHLNADAVGSLAAGAGASRVLLTHLQMGHDRRATVEAVRNRFDGPVELVEPGGRFEV